jgi:SAM-dependent methyltransferase
MATTILWLTLTQGAVAFLSGNLALLFTALVVVVALTTCNLVIRWVRWHYLLRRFQLELATKDSLKLWLISLPAIATPFYIGELVRAALLAKRYPKSLWRITGIWLVERFADFIIVAMVYLVMKEEWLKIFLLFGLGAVILLVLNLTFKAYVIRTLSRPSVAGMILFTTICAWIFPVLGLWAVVHQLGAQITGAGVAEVFSVGTLIGGITGIPLGIGVTGSIMIFLLQIHEIGSEIATVSIAVFRAGTVWYAIGIGLSTVILWKDYIVQLFRFRPPRYHFDLIAQEYEEDLPEHVRERLLNRKIEAMQYWLDRAGAKKGLLGLDIGCGHGWYATEMSRRGYRINACDLSYLQIKQADNFIRKQGVELDLSVANGSSLPYADCTFDFAYGVNVLHHITSFKQRREAFQEIVRVIKPGGIFFLQEINTENPLFRFYMGYLFPLLRDIDDGTEKWVLPTELPTLEHAVWEDEILYFNFFPDFAPSLIIKLFGGFERYLERSPLRTWSSHYVACLCKENVESIEG